MYYRGWSYGLRLLRPLIHLIVVGFIFFGLYQLRSVTDLIPFVDLRVPFLDRFDNMIFVVVATVLFVVLGFVRQIYDLRISIEEYGKRFFKHWLMWRSLITFVAYFGYGFVFIGGVSRFLIIRGGIFCGFFVLLIDQIINRLISKKEKSDRLKTLVFAQNSSSAQKVFALLGDRYDCVWHHFDDHRGLVYDQYHLVIALGSCDNNTLQTISDAVRGKNVRFFHVIEGFFLEDLIYEPQRVGSILALEYKPTRLEGRSQFFKRLFDICFSLLVLIVGLPLFVFIAVYIMINDGYPFLYRSERVGRGGKTFWMYKFRTMIRDADKLKHQLQQHNQRGGPLFKIDNDPRVPAWGKFLRRYSLDEIPQFFNVLEGSMSVVGPRPHLPHEVAQYQHRHKRLLTIKPGITGYAQVFGRDSLHFDQEATLDLYYIQNWSVFLDIFVIFSTFSVLHKGK